MSKIKRTILKVGDRVKIKEINYEVFLGSGYFNDEQKDFFKLNRTYVVTSIEDSCTYSGLHIKGIYLNKDEFTFYEKELELVSQSIKFEDYKKCEQFA